MDFNNKKACYSVLWGHFSPRKKLFELNTQPIGKKIKFFGGSQNIWRYREAQGDQEVQKNTFGKYSMQGIPREIFSKKNWSLGTPLVPVCPANVSMQDQNNNQQQFATLPGVQQARHIRKPKLVSLWASHFPIHYYFSLRLSGLCAHMEVLLGRTIFFWFNDFWKI